MGSFQVLIFVLFFFLPVHLFVEGNGETVKKYYLFFLMYVKLNFSVLDGEQKP
jgi:hypothetical protein